MFNFYKSCLYRTLYLVTNWKISFKILFIVFEIFIKNIIIYIYKFYLILIKIVTGNRAVLFIINDRNQI